MGSGQDGEVPAGGGLSRRGFLQVAGLGTGAAVLASAWPGWARPASATSIDPASLLNPPPFSFIYDGVSSSSLLASWPKTTDVTVSGAVTTTTVTWTDVNTGLQVKWVRRAYASLSTLDWKVFFTNIGSAITPQLESVLSLDVSVGGIPDPNWVIHSAAGSANLPTDFAPYDVPLLQNSFKTFTTGGGRPTNGYPSGTLTDTDIGGGFPYYNIDWATGGMIVALGWPGQWVAEVKRGTSDLRVLGGMANSGILSNGQEIGAAGLSSVWLDPGESFYAPEIVLQPWSGGDWHDAQNLWRRWMVNHRIPTKGAAPAVPICPGQANDYYPYFPGLYTSAAAENEWQNAYAANNATAGTGGVHDHWWTDAGWYEQPSYASDWVPTGTWTPDADRFPAPNGLKPVTDRAHQLGMSAIVWFEPERVMPGTDLAVQHPEWLLSPAGTGQFGGAAKLLDFGNPDARSWATNYFGSFIAAQGIDLYREDFNIDPLEFWNQRDTNEQVYQASAEFSSIQGARGWRYQKQSGASWVNITTYSASGYQGQRQWHDGTSSGYVWPGRIHPGTSGDTALSWTAPRPGTIDISGRAAYPAAPFPPGDPAGDGVTVEITKNGSTIFGPAYIAGNDTVGVQTDVRYLTVASGDVIRFQVNRNSTFDSDSTAWDPTITYRGPARASEGFTGVQGANGWRYQNQNGAGWSDILNFTPSGYLGQPQWHDIDGGYVWPGRIHPGPNIDCALAWTAPRSGIVDVTGRASKAPDPQGDGVVVRITRNGTTLFGPSYIAGGDTSGVDTNLKNVSVNAGDILRFQINRNGVDASDSTAWDPVITYRGQNGRQGITQIRYVMGHLEYWAALRALSPTMLIDNCASGGRRLDVLSLSLSINLLRSDFVFDPPANQNHTYGISSWIPFNGGAVRVEGGDAPYDRYKARSGMTTSFHLALDIHQATANDWSTFKAMAQEWKTISPCLLGPYYPLSAFDSNPATAIMAYQFQAPDLLSGFLQVFRRPSSPATSLLVRLRNLTGSAVYTVYNYETGWSFTAPGSDLMTLGFTVPMPYAPYATTIRFTI